MLPHELAEWVAKLSAIDYADLHDYLNDNRVAILDAGLLVLVGYSDDVICMYGTVYDEIPAGETIISDHTFAPFVNTCDCGDNCPNFWKIMDQVPHFTIEGEMKHDGFNIKSDIPWAISFEIMEDDDRYGNGLIIYTKTG